MQLFVSTLTQIFAVGILIVHSKPNSVKGYDTNQKSTPTSITMAIRACRVIRTIERIPINTETHIVCYCTFVSFISALIESADTEGNTFVARLCEVLQELDVVRSLVVQSNVLSLEDGNWTSSSYSNGIERLLSQNTTSAVLVTLHLFLRLATTGMVDTIRLLISNNAAQILWTKNIDANIQNQCRSKLSVLHGETTSVLDTLGNTLRTKVQFITVCLRSLNIWDTVQQDDSFLFIKAAIDFFHANQTSLLKCIENCITMIDSKQRVLTPEALIDAEHALSLIAELCTHRTLEILQRESVEVVFIIRKYALFVVATLGNFLGASAASREIFRATDNMVNEQSRGLVNAAEGGLIGPDQRLFAGGFQNATHEAIRYSHFVSKFLPKILSLDFGTEVLAGSASTRRSMSSLESACRVAVTKDFELIESQVCDQCAFCNPRISLASSFNLTIL